jgi:renalase
MRVLVVGAGISGCICARRLSDFGYEVTVVEKGRGVGGRMSTRRMNGARIDHGAQFFTIRDDRLLGYLQEWRNGDSVAEWYDHVPNRSDLADRSRFRGVLGMTDPAKHLLRNLKVEKNFFVEFIQWSGGAWTVKEKGTSGRSLKVDHLVLTLPVPQMLKLFALSSFELQPQVMSNLRNIRYSRCLALFGLLDRVSSIPCPGIITHPTPKVDWLADNQVKGISQKPAFTLHASSQFSDEIWNVPDNDGILSLVPVVEGLMQAKILEWAIHRWHFSKPLVTFGESHFHSPDRHLSLAGDGFSGERVESAAISGWEAAESITQGA